MEASIGGLDDSIKKSKERLITATRNSTDNIRINSNNNLETGIKGKTTVWIFQETNKGNLTREDLNMAKKGKPYERKLISSNSSTK